MFRRKSYKPTEFIYLAKMDGKIFPDVDIVQIRWGIRWAHIYMNGEKLGKILRSAAKQKFIEI